MIRPNPGKDILDKVSGGGSAFPVSPWWQQQNNTPPPPGDRKTGEQLQKEAEARADAKEKARRTAAGRRSLEQAKNLEAQAKALEHALDVSYGKALKQNLSDVQNIYRRQTRQLRKTAKERAQSFLATASDTSKATAQQAESSFGSLVTERADTMTGLLEQGAGQTDMLRAMVVAARNFQANLEKGNRAHFDTMRTINSGISDLNTDTKVALSNAFTSRENERERLYQNYFDRRSESFTQLGNIRGQQADYYAAAKEMDVTPGGKMVAANKSDMKTAYMNAAKESGKSYKQRELPDWIKDYEGQAQVDSKLSNTNLAAAPQFRTVGRAEGASLRRWA